jgi:protein TonB
VGLTLLIFLSLPILNTYRGESSVNPRTGLLDPVQIRPETVEANPESLPDRKAESVFSTPPETRLVQPDKKPKQVYNKPEVGLALPIEIDTKLQESPGALLLPTLDIAAMPVFQPLTGVFSEGQLDLPLTAQVRVPPVYPIQARRRGTEGWVKVLLTVDEKGDVTETVIVDADPEGVFEKSVKHCISRWRFKPGTVGGVPVKARFETTIEFKLASG